jgi:hypothetical protein
VSVSQNVKSWAARLADPLSPDGRTALAELRGFDAATFDALLGDTAIQDGVPEVRGPLREVCHRSITKYDGLYDTYISDPYVYAQPLIEVLAAAPPGTRAAGLRDELTSLRLLYPPPTSFPEERVDLRPLATFPRLGALEVEYPCVGGGVCAAMRTLEALSLTRGFDELGLPPWLKRLRLYSPAPSAELAGAMPRSLRELTVDANSARPVRSLESPTALRSLTYRVEHGDDGGELAALLSWASPSLESLRVRGITPRAVRVPSRLRSLSELDLVAYDLAVEPLPALRSARIGAWERLEWHEQPALRELTVSAGTDLRALTSCRNIEVLTIDFLVRKTPGPFPLSMPALRELRLRGGEDLSIVPCYPTLQTIRVDEKTRVDTLPEPLRAIVSYD